jgi:hypothetical protein
MMDKGIQRKLSAAQILVQENSKQKGNKEQWLD